MAAPEAPDAPFDPHDSAAAESCDARTDAPCTLTSPCVPRADAQAIAGRMAAGTITAEEILGPGRLLVRHLLRGCPDCALAFGRGAGLPAALRPLPLFHYQAGVDRGIRLTLESLRNGKIGPAKAPDWTFGRNRAEALVAEARKLRRDDPETGLELLDEALRRIRKSEALVEGEGREALFCKIHTERANLLRLLGRHPGAEVAFRSALSSSPTGGEAAEALLNLGDQYASFLIARRRFDEADGLLDHLIRVLTMRGDVAHAGKLAIIRSLVAAYSGDHRRALGLIGQALRLLHGTETLELQLNAVQLSIAWNVELGNLQDASDSADQIRAEYHRHMGASDRAKFLFYDAQIFHGLGRPSLAEELLRRVKGQFEDLGLPFQAALVGLDLAAKLVERRRAAEARPLIVEELIPTFRAVGVAREGLAALVLLERATEAAALDAAVLKSVLRDLERAGQEVAPRGRESEPEDEAPDFA